jgi:formamidopyrimidine-DNA glycosylase
MPELPEVETVARGLKKYILGKTIAKVDWCAPHLRLINTRGFAKNLERKTIKDIRRIGKNLFLHFHDNSFLWTHLRMTGQFLFKTKSCPDDNHNHIILRFKETSQPLIFRDVRKFGQMIYVPIKQQKQFLKKLNLGSDALKISEDEFTGLLRSKNRMIKPLLLDQSLVAGLGNIYVDEILYKSRIHPRKISSAISKLKLKELYYNMREILLYAIDNMGTTFDSFAGVESEPGNFQSYLNAYGREGKLCRRCGKSKIKRIIVAQRGTCYCPNCQRN